jgi:hypothetical protein
MTGTTIICGDCLEEMLASTRAEIKILRDCAGVQA